MTASAVDRNFKNLAPTQEEEDAYDYVKFREGVHPTSLLSAIAHLIKGALGAGILSGHVAYSKGGIYASIPVNILCGIYMGFCLFLLVKSMQKLLKRTKRPFLSYADTGEAAMMLFPKPGVAKWAKSFRYSIDTIISIDLFGACCTYQLIIAKSLKQLVENTHKTAMEGPPGYPGMRVYLVMLLPLIMLICLIRHLKYLAPFSLAANVVIVFCIGLACYYCFTYNPSLSDMLGITNFTGFLQMVGMSVFSMSCSGLVIPVESNMRNPKQFGTALTFGMGFIIAATTLTSTFGYAAFLQDSTAPITVNFPMTPVAIFFKAAIVAMIIITHAVNFWVPFNLCWYYIRKRHNPNRLVMWERIWRMIFVVTICTIAVIFPTINALMGFIGCFCLTNMAFIWPSVIFLLTYYERPGYGPYKWRLIIAIIFIIIGIMIFCCGSIVNARELAKVFTGKHEH